QPRRAALLRPLWIYFRFTSDCKQRNLHRTGLDHLEEILAALHAFHRDSRGESQMIPVRAGLGILSVVLGTSTLYAGELSSYRGFHFGMKLSDAAKQAGMNPSEAIVVHRRPAV